MLIDFGGPPEVGMAINVSDPCRWRLKRRKSNRSVTINVPPETPVMGRREECGTSPFQAIHVCGPRRPWLRRQLPCMNSMASTCQALRRTTAIAGILSHRFTFYSHTRIPADVVDFAQRDPEYPSIALAMAVISSSDRLCVDRPAFTGFA